MPAHMYDYTVPALLRGLGVLQSYLDRMQAAVHAGQSTGAELLRARLADDMLPLGRQFQIASDNAKNGVARLTGQEAPWFADDERTIGDYRDRIEKTSAFLRTLTPEAFEGSQARMIDQSYRRVGSAMSGEDYLRALLLPNFYFHIAVAHAILRHKGIRLGKSDYLGTLPVLASMGMGSSSDGIPVRFLTQAESIEWLAGRGLQEVPATDEPGSSHFQFDLQPIPVRLSDLVGSLMEDLGGFEGGLLLLSDWIWDDEYEGDPTAPYREAQKEARPLNQAPGLLLEKSARDDAVALLTLLVERKWTGQFYFASGATTLRIVEGDRVHVHTVNPEAERLVRYRLVVSGSDVLPI
ncbi:DUF1993 domain-containing protein [Frateuria hangzhouensis]|uniref:DUF1993 domain-containing protein n=1 Tax=Frateuria hangzhouensis TaxID=2995589 RepID=UPI002260A785|nr:DUF1993 domain-containing protein [Frateuria sp. STR12]MCX7513088.1 DUF1993 domain-containing protein [Frateuria sp. STR12]